MLRWELSTQRAPCELEPPVKRIPPALLLKLHPKALLALHLPAVLLHIPTQHFLLPRLKDKIPQELLGGWWGGLYLTSVSQEADDIIIIIIIQQCVPIRPGRGCCTLLGH